MTFPLIMPRHKFKKTIFLWIFKKEIFLIYTVLVLLWFFEIYRYYTGGFRQSWRVHDKSNQSTEITVRSITTQRLTSHTGTEHSQSEIDDDGNFFGSVLQDSLICFFVHTECHKMKGGGRLNIFVIIWYRYNLQYERYSLLYRSMSVTFKASVSGVCVVWRISSLRWQGNIYV